MITCKRIDGECTETQVGEEITFLSRKILDLNKKLIESEKAKSRFLSLVASELNNPMTALLGLVVHIETTPGSKSEQICTMLYHEALRLDFRIQNIVASAQIESGTLQIAHASLDLGVILSEVLDTLQYLAQEKPMRLEVRNRLEARLVGDPSKLYLILKNLIANAYMYGKEGGEIAITLSHEEERLTLEVRNEGCAPQLEYPAEIFGRLSGAPDGAHGLGLGLSIVRDFCEKLEGSVRFEGDQRQVRFIVTLPYVCEGADSKACGADEFLFESFDDAVEF